MVQRRFLTPPPRLEIDEIAIRWMTAFARENYWRVAAWIKLDDLISEGYFTWYRIVQGEMRDGPYTKDRIDKKTGEVKKGHRSAMWKYKYITDRRQLMGLFMRTLEQHFNDLAAGRTKLPILAESDIIAMDEDFALENVPAPEHSYGFDKLTAERAIQAAPLEIQRLVAIVAKKKMGAEFGREGRQVIAYFSCRNRRTYLCERANARRHSRDFPSYLEWWHSHFARPAKSPRQEAETSGMLVTA